MKRLYNVGGPAIYLAGPMTGIEKNNKEAFGVYARTLSAMGFKVLNPADFDFEYGGQPSNDAFYRRDVAVMLEKDVQMMALLPGWERSYGVTKIELPLAVGLKIPVVLADSLIKAVPAAFKGVPLFIHLDQKKAYEAAKAKIEARMQNETANQEPSGLGWAMDFSALPTGEQPAASTGPDPAPCTPYPDSPLDFRASPEVRPLDLDAFKARLESKRSIHKNITKAPAKFKKAKPNKYIKLLAKNRKAALSKIVRSAEKRNA